MTATSMSRRGFILGSAAAGIAATLPLRSAIAGAQTGTHIYMQIFLRGGMDGLSALIPHGDPDYHALRPLLGFNANEVIDIDGYWGLHGAMAPLVPIYQSGSLAIIPAAGTPHASRSHFEAMDIMEYARPANNPSVFTGWLGRHLASLPGADPTLSGVAIGQSVPASMRGYGQAISIDSIASFSLYYGNRNAAVHDNALLDMYPEPPSGAVETQSVNCLSAIRALSAASGGATDPPSAYGTSGVGRALWNAAQLINLNIGVEGITVDHGGWDHHDHLRGQFNAQMTELATGLAAFWSDISQYHDNVTVVVQSEFGRRAYENASEGTDHGSGGVMMVLGGLVNGGLRGEWPGLEAAALDDGDVAVANDYRYVVAEVLDRAVGNGAALGTVLPGLSIAPADYLGVIS